MALLIGLVILAVYVLAASRIIRFVLKPLMPAYLAKTAKMQFQLLDIYILILLLGAFGSVVATNQESKEYLFQFLIAGSTVGICEWFVIVKLLSANRITRAMKRVGFHLLVPILLISCIMFLNMLIADIVVGFLILSEGSRSYLRLNLWWPLALIPFAGIRWYATWLSRNPDFSPRDDSAAGIPPTGNPAA